MKAIVIDSKFVKRELLILLGCFVAAVIFDLVAIIIYSRPAIELLVTVGYEIAITLNLYVVLAVFRIIFFLIRQIFTKN